MFDVGILISTNIITDAISAKTKILLLYFKIANRINPAGIKTKAPLVPENSIESIYTQAKKSKINFFFKEMGPVINPIQSILDTTIVYAKITGSLKMENFLQVPPINSKAPIFGMVSFYK